MGSIEKRRGICGQDRDGDVGAGGTKESKTEAQVVG